MTFGQSDNKIGVPDVTSVITAGNIGTPGNAQLPSVTTWGQLGQITEAWDDVTYGVAKFILLAVAPTITVTPGLLYQWDTNYQVTVIPAGSSSKNSGVAVAVAINTVASNATQTQYTWFLIQGQYAVLKTAVTIPPQSKVYMSATAGRFYSTASAGKQILGARTNNTATVTSTTSSVLVYLNYSAMEGA